VEKIDGKIFSVRLRNDKAEFRGLGHKHHGLPQLLGAVEQNRPGGGLVHEESGGNGVEGDELGVGGYAADRAGHSLAFGQGDAEPFAVGQLLPMHLGGHGWDREKQHRND
jgi:hypothetical protein